MRVLKFGGSSVASAPCIRRVVDIVQAARKAGPVTVVVSAFGGVTDQLQETARQAAAGDAAYRQSLEAVARRHRETLAELVPDAAVGPYRQRLDGHLEELSAILQGCFLVEEASPRSRDRILGFGELLSAQVVAAAFSAAGLAAEARDARHLIVTDESFGNAQVDLEATRRRVQESFGAEAEADDGPLPIVTGFIAASPRGEVTTLGRGGSDSTASILGAALDAEAVELWTDVDGVMNADPRLVPGATSIPRLSYSELLELSHFGARVVYPPSIQPIREREIPLVIRNTFRPEAPGTRVDRFQEPGPGPVRGIASVPRIALLRLEGPGMVGVPGIAMRLFGALARGGISVILITQASSEHSICFAVAPEDLEEACSRIGEEFALERRAGLIQELVIEENLAVVAAVGSGMRERAGLAGRIFTVLGQHGISVRAIAQGSSELNISMVVSSGDEWTAVRCLHEACFSEEIRTIELYLAGVGRVGRALLDQLAAQQREMEEARGLRLILAGAASSRSHLLDREGLAPSSVLPALQEAAGAGSSGEEPDESPIEELLAGVSGSRRLDRILVDCTADGRVAEVYDRALAHGVSVVTANKLRMAGPLEGYRTLQAPLPGSLYFETTVGAGLPVIRTLQDLMATGDRLLRIEGLLSGTLTYLMDQLHLGASFSEAVRKAYDLGYTEPDPREDLGGRDVARKLLILARVAGREMEPSEVEPEPLLPAEPWGSLTLDELWQRLPEADEGFDRLKAEAEAAGRRLVFLASLDGEGARVSLTQVEADHPCAGVRGSDNLIAFTTERYRTTPLVLRGPGAGPDVTAAGVFSDVLRAVAEAPGRGLLAPRHD